MAENEEKINEYQLKITGKCSLPQPLKYKGDYIIATEIHVDDKKFQDNHDGTSNLIYKGVQTGKAVIQNELKKKMEVIDKTKESVKTRLKIQDYYNSHDTGMSEEGFYKYAQGKYRYYFEEIMEYIKKLEEESDG